MLLQIIKVEKNEKFKKCNMPNKGKESRRQRVAATSHKQQPKPNEKCKVEKKVYKRQRFKSSKSYKVKKQRRE